MPDASTLLATGFIADTSEEGSFIPTMLANSANATVQAVYWRCIANFYYSARLNNPVQRLALFSNVTPPVVDGIDIAALLARFGVEHHLLPLTARLPSDRVTAWGNVLYFYDIMSHLAASEDPQLRFALVDSDVLVLGSTAPLFALLDEHDFVGYHVEETRDDENINGLTPVEMGAIARAMGGVGPGPVVHYGGELFVTTPAAWLEGNGPFLAMLEAAASGRGAGAATTTEEHVYSIAAALAPERWAQANGLLKRMWTSVYFNNVRSGDETLAIWHVPAEKRYGLRDLFNDLRIQDFPMTISPAALRAMAMRRCGIPTKSLSKWLCDGVRQVIGKMGLRN